MRKFLDYACAGWLALSLHPLQNIATLACLLVVLVPFLCGVGISHGIQVEAEQSIDAGPDLYVRGERFGRPASIPLAAADTIRKIHGVVRVTPRIVGAVTLGRANEPAVVVGLPGEAVPAAFPDVAGRLFHPGSQGELVVGSELARRLHLQPGSRIPPFYRSSQGEHVLEVVGVFHPDASLWQPFVMVTSLETAAAIFDQSNEVTDLLVECQAGYQDSVQRQVMRVLGPEQVGTGLRPRVISREELSAVLPRGLLHREGVFHLHFVLAGVAGTLAILMTTGFGLTERRREIGILKALGWQTDAVMLRSLIESLLLSVAGAAMAIVMAFVWLELFNGVGIAGIFLADVEPISAFPIPFRLTPVPAFLSLVLAFVMVMTGSLYATWRAATVPPREAMR